MHGVMVREELYSLVSPGFSQPEQAIKECLSVVSPMCPLHLSILSQCLLVLHQQEERPSIPYCGYCQDFTAVGCCKAEQASAETISPSQGCCYTGQAKIDPLYFVRAGRTWKSTW